MIEQDWYIRTFHVTAQAQATAGPGVENPLTAEEIEADLERLLEELEDRFDGYVISNVRVTLSDPQN